MNNKFEKRLAKRQERYDRSIKKKLQKQRYKDQIKGIKINTFTKAITFIIIIVSLIDLQLTYILAYMDKMYIAEELSKQICVTIIGTSLIYMVRAFFDTKAEHNEKLTREILERKFKEKANDVLCSSETGISDIEELGITEEDSNNDDESYDD